MAILDTLIIQLDLDSSALAKGAAAAQQNLIRLEQQAEHTAQSTRQALDDQLGQAASNGADTFRRFRQEAMGALALFTGGRSLAGLGQEITQANEGLSTLAARLTTLPAGLSDLHKATQGLSTLSAPPIPTLPVPDGQTAGEQTNSPVSHTPILPEPPHTNLLPDMAPDKTPPLPTPPLPTQDIAAQDIATQGVSAQDMLTRGMLAQTMLAQTIRTQPPTRSSLPPQPHPAPPAIAPHTSSALADWAALLGRASHLARQALQEVEPTLHNAEQAMARFTARLSTKTPRPPAWQADMAQSTRPIPALLDASALLTARSILTAQPVPHTSPVKPAPSAQTHQAQTSLTTPKGDTTSQPLTHPARPAPALSAQSPSPPSTLAHTAQATFPPPAGPRPHQAVSAHQGQLAQISHSLHRLHQALTSQLMADSTTPPATTQLAPLPPALTRLVGQVDKAAPPRHLTTHNNTTHSPTIHITVTAGNAAPHDIARAVQDQAFAHFNTYRRIA